MLERCDFPNDDLSGDGNVSADGAGPLSRSSVTHVSYIVSKFSDVKKNLVREIGFEGILDLPQITKVDRKFTLWLLSKVDTEKRSIIVNDQCVADFVDFEVARIMGIPCGSSEVCSLDSSDKKSKLEFIQNFIGSLDHELNSLTAAENNVKALFDPPTSMSLKDKDNFKVSFVVWVMGHLLAPTKKHNVGGDRFWGALLAPDEINKFNWCQYVIDELIAAARDVQIALKQNKHINTMTRCSILLQIIYFESIDMGTLNRLRGIRPCVKVYDAKSLSMMIAADKASSATGSPNPTWGSSVRRLPEARRGTIPLASRTCINTDDNLRGQDDIINDFGTYVRANFGEKVSLNQSVALSWFHAKCTQHMKQLRLNIQKDTIALVGKLFGSRNVSMPTLPAKPNIPTPKARQAHSEPWRSPRYGSILRKNKRGCESSGTFYKRQGPKKHRVSFRQFELPETLLSGMSVSDEHNVGDQLSDSGYDTDAATHNPGWNIEVPSFDLGIELNTESNNNPHVPATNNVLAGSSVVDKLSGFIGNPSLTDSSAEGAPTANIEGISMVSITDSSDHSLSVPDDACAGSSTPISYFNAVPHTPPSAKTIVSPKFTTPDQKIKNSSASPRSLSKILAEADLVERMTRSEDILNINIKPWDDDYSDSPVKKRTIDPPKLGECPSTYNLHHRSPPRDIVEKLFQDVSVCNYTALNKPWLGHASPRHIEVDGTWIHKGFITEVGLSYDVFDLAIRRLKQLDDIMYSVSSTSRWRHIMDSEFALFALAGEIPYNRKSIIEQFIGSSMHYKLEHCRMIVVPAFILLNWSCYFFDFKDKCVHVIDPLYNKCQSDIFHKMHLPNISKVGASLDNCFEVFFENWHHSCLNWDVNFVEASISDATSAETGLLTLMYIREFEGSFGYLVNREYFEFFKKLMLYELMSLSDNAAKPPVNLPITIDD